MSEMEYSEIRKQLGYASEIVPEGFYAHYKSGDVYKVIGYCMLEATCEPAIQYVAAEDPSVTWVRSLEVWTELVTSEDQPVPRFSRLA